MTDKKNVEIVKDSTATEENPGGFVRLPVKDENLKKFIVSLLGEPQSIEKEYREFFVIRRENISDLCNLIRQRIDEQNNGKEIRFSGEIVLTDDTLYKFNSFNEFISFNPVKNCTTNSIDIKVSYLIQFSQKNYPEKQDIEILVQRNKSRIYHNNRASAPIYVKINHTARSWGNDLLNLLDHKMLSLAYGLEKPSILRRILEKIGEKIGYISFALGLLFAITFVSKYFYSIKTKVLDDIGLMPGDISHKIDVISNFIVSGVFYRITICFFIYITLLIIFSAFLSNFIDKHKADIRTEPFILFSEKDGLEFEQYQKDKKKDDLSKIYQIIGGLLLNIAASFFYSIICKFFVI